MKQRLRRSYCLPIALSIAVIFLGVVPAVAQKDKSYDREFCTNKNYSSRDSVQSYDLREMTIPATGQLSVDAGQNGGVRILGENRSDVLVRACVQAWGKTDDAAKAAVAGVRIETVGTIKAVNPAAENWSVSFEIRAPRSSDLDLNAINGGITITGVEGRLYFETRNGGVHLSDVAGDVRGKTTNGGVHVRLAGNSWKGSGLNVETTNGGVHLAVAGNYAAHIETGTVNGGFHSDIPGLSIDRKDRSRPARVSADLNGGGAPIRVVTTNGGIHINSSEQSDDDN